MFGFWQNTETTGTRLTSFLPSLMSGCSAVALSAGQKRSSRRASAAARHSGFGNLIWENGLWVGYREGLWEGLCGGPWGVSGTGPERFAGIDNLRVKVSASLISVMAHV
jgi:hypothetical protein